MVKLVYSASRTLLFVHCREVKLTIKNTAADCHIVVTDICSHLKNYYSISFYEKFHVVRVHFTYLLFFWSKAY